MPSNGNALISILTTQLFSFNIWMSKRSAAKYENHLIFSTHIEYIYEPIIRA